MAITSIRVAPKSVRVNERFAGWLKDKQQYVLNKLDLTNDYIPVLVKDGDLPDLLLKVGDGFDLMHFSKNHEDRYVVSFLEYELGEENEHSYVGTNTEHFDISKRHDAIEAFMFRWDSDNPVKPSK